MISPRCIRNAGFAPFLSGVKSAAIGESLPPRSRDSHPNRLTRRTSIPRLRDFIRASLSDDVRECALTIVGGRRDRSDLCLAPVQHAPRTVDRRAGRRWGTDKKWVRESFG